MPNNTGLQLHSLVTADGELHLTLARVETPAPGPDDVTVRIEATPINPSDLGLLLGAADPETATQTGTPEAPAITAKIPAARMAAMAGRIGEPMPVGNEGAGTVIAAGASDAAQALLGKKVAVLGGAMYGQFRTLSAGDCLPLPEGATAADGASCFVNPLTALSMVETLRREGHTALVHTAAASNLGQMLVKICLKDGVPLVNIVRSAAQADLLRGIGATPIVDSTAPDFIADLTRAVTETGATLAFDAIGGGKLASQILSAMEAAAVSRATAYSRYGSTVHKQVYIYGALDLRPTELVRNYGMIWGVGGWLLTPFLMKIGAEGRQAMRDRVAAELHTTFKSHYTQEISLAETLQPDILKAYSKRATGEKYLINPAKA
jgi:NADPH:quinone reductase-like Zn-dependent oxidoreductase